MLFLLLATARIAWRFYKLVVPCGRELINSACELPLIILVIALLLRFGLPLHDLALWRAYWYETLSNTTGAVLASTRNSTEFTLYPNFTALYWRAMRIY